MVKEICTKASSNNCLQLLGEKFASLNEILPVHQDYNPNDQERISKSQVGSEHAKCYSEHNSECIPFHVNKHVDCVFLYWNHHSSIFWKWAYIFLIGRKRANQNDDVTSTRACTRRDWLAMSKPVQSKKSQRPTDKRLWSFVPEMISHVYTHDFFCRI